MIKLWPASLHWSLFRRPPTRTPGSFHGNKPIPGHIIQSGFGLRYVVDLSSVETGPKATISFLIFKNWVVSLAVVSFILTAIQTLGPESSEGLGQAASLIQPVYKCMLLCTDTIDVSPVQMDFSMIAQRTAKDNSSLNLISTKRWWALFWLAWLTVRLYVGLLRWNVISWALSARTSVIALLFHFRPIWIPSVLFMSFVSHWGQSVNACSWMFVRSCSWKWLFNE